MDSFMCSATDSINVFYDSSELVIANFGYQNIADSIILSDSSINGINYYWDFGDSSYDSTISPTHIYQSSGSYFIVLTTSNNCFVDTAGKWISIIMTGLEKTDRQSFKIFPNPTNGISYISLKNNQLYPIYLKIYDNFGKLVHEHQWSNNTAKGLKKIDLLEFANGQYYFEFTAKDFKQIHKVIID
jgi:PKD repeat protein